MGIGSFFHKLKIFFLRLISPPIPYVSEMKLYGNQGEDKFASLLKLKLQNCKITQNDVC